MKAYIETQTRPGGGWEHTEVANWQHAIRITARLAKHGEKAQYWLIPESAADVIRIVNKGRMVCKRILTMEHVATSLAQRAATRALGTVMNG